MMMGGLRSGGPAIGSGSAGVTGAGSTATSRRTNRAAVMAAEFSATSRRTNRAAVMAAEFTATAWRSNRAVGTGLGRTIASSITIGHRAATAVEAETIEAAAISGRRRNWAEIFITGRFCLFPDRCQQLIYFFGGPVLATGGDLSGGGAGNATKI